MAFKTIADRHHSMNLPFTDAAGALPSSHLTGCLPILSNAWFSSPSGCWWTVRRGVLIRYRGLCGVLLPPYISRLNVCLAVLARHRLPNALTILFRPRSRPVGVGVMVSVFCRSSFDILSGFRLRHGTEPLPCQAFASANAPTLHTAVTRFVGRYRTTLSPLLF